MPTVSDILRKSISKYGINTINRGESLPLDFPRIPSGIFSIDYAIGGGFPVGVASCLYGPPSGGKTLLLLKVIACAQQLCWRCFEYKWDCQCKEGPKEQEVAIVTTEVLDAEWAKCLGVDIEKLMVAEPEYGEQAADIISEFLLAEDCGLVCLDSIAMMVPIVELESSFNESQVGALPRLVAKLMRVLEARLIREKKKGHNVAFIATNHIRSKIGTFFGNPEDVAGGWAAKHTWHLTLRMSQLSADDKDKDTDMPINAKFKASTVALSNKRKIFMLQGAAEFFCSMVDRGEFVRGTIPDFKTVEKYADEIEFIGRNPWSCMGRTYDKKSDLIKDWQENSFYLSVKKKLVEEYRNIAKMEMGL